MSSAIDMSGQRFGRLLIVGRSGSSADNGSACWLTRCDCGAEKKVRRGSLVSGRTKSCGCLAREAGSRNAPIAHAAAKKHGQCGSGVPTKLYRTWTSMKSRCLTKSAGNYGRYGAKGVTVFESWVNNFEEFAKYVGEPPTEKHSIDRINNALGYQPGNVRWATAKEQANNRTNNRRNSNA